MPPGNEKKPMLQKSGAMHLQNGSRKVPVRATSNSDEKSALSVVDTICGSSPTEKLFC